MEAVHLEVEEAGLAAQADLLGLVALVALVALVTKDLFNVMVYDRTAIGGGIDIHGRPWTGGSLDPRNHDYHARPHPTPHTVRCLRNMEAESKNHNSISSGVENCPKLTPKSTLLTSSRLVWAGVLDNGFDMYFYVEDAQTAEWHNLFLNPDVISKDEVETHKEYLRMPCRNAAENLEALQVVKQARNCRRGLSFPRLQVIRRDL